MILDAEARGRITPGCELIESTSGNLGVALASICAARGYRITLVTDPNVNVRTLRFIKALGAEVVMVDQRDRAGGYLATRIEYIRRRTAADSRLIWLNQYANPVNATAHSIHTVGEILEGFGAPNWLFVGTGTSGTLMGCVRGLREAGASTNIVAVDAVGSVTFGGASGRRWIPGIGTSRVPEIFIDDGSFRKVLVDERDAVRTCRRVAREHGLLLGGSSGSTLAAVAALSDRIAPGAASGHLPGHGGGLSRHRLQRRLGRRTIRGRSPRRHGAKSSRIPAGLTTTRLRGTNVLEFSVLSGSDVMAILAGREK